MYLKYVSFIFNYSEELTNFNHLHDSKDKNIYSSLRNSTQDDVFVNSTGPIWTSVKLSFNIVLLACDSQVSLETVKNV